MTLSIIVPTYNRGACLAESLPWLKEQVIRNRSKVELIVCDNASTDNTVDILNRINGDDPFFSVVRYREHAASVGTSIARSAENGIGRYLLLWSDDDIPAPWMIDMYLEDINKHPDAISIVSNRFYAISDNLVPVLPVHGAGVLDRNFPEYSKTYIDAGQFILEHINSFTFLGVNVIRRAEFLGEMNHFSDKYFGWEYLLPMLIAMSKGPNVYLSFPSCCQRGITGFANHAVKWPLFVYCGLPRLLVKAQELGVINSWRKVYSEYRNTKRDFCKAIFDHALLSPDLYLPYVKEMKSYQTSWIRRHVLGLIGASAWRKAMARMLFRFAMSRIGKFGLKCLKMMLLRRAKR